MVIRTPRWAAEAVAWSAALVLVAGVAVAGSGVVQHRVEAKERKLVADTPVLASTTTTGAKRSPRSVPQVRNGSRVALESATIASLGPPPGPVNDRVPTRFAPPEKRFAFLVGVGDYRKPTKDTLAGDKDVLFLRSYLLAAGWKAENIRMVTNKQATGSAMRSGLRWLAAQSVPGTFSLFHYSGHVKQEGGREKLWPYDRKFVPDNELVKLLRPSRGMLWVDIAGCEAGGFIEQLPSERVLVSASSKRTQKSYEHPDWQESVWVGLLWDAGMNQRQADANGNGIVTVGESLRFAAYWAEVVTFYQRPHGRQTPQVKGMPVRGWTLADPPA